MSRTTPSISQQVLLKTIGSLTQDGTPFVSWEEVLMTLGLPERGREALIRELEPVQASLWVPASGHAGAALTAAGRELVMSAPDPPSDRSQAWHVPIDERVLPLLACGLVQMYEDAEKGSPLRAPYPAAWQRGMNVFAAECLLRAVLPPSQHYELRDLCKKPANTWGVRLPGWAYPLDEPLLANDGRPGELCHELAGFAEGVSRANAEAEFFEQKMDRLRRRARELGSQAAYVAVRRYVIEHPAVFQGQRTRAVQRDDHLHLLAAELHELYDPEVPTTAVWTELPGEGKALLCCGFCGWPLTRPYPGQSFVRCGDARCARMTRDFRRPKPKHLVPAPGQRNGKAQRVHPAIRRYVVVPGLTELRLFRELVRIGLDVKLWPEFDTYDLRVRFRNGKTWAIDVKDWRSPQQLARTLKPLSTGRSSHYDQAFYVIPDSRVRDLPGYIDQLGFALWGGQGGDASDRPFNLVAAIDLLRLAREKEGNDAIS